MTSEPNNNYLIRFEISNNSSTIRFDSKPKKHYLHSTNLNCNQLLLLLGIDAYYVLKWDVAVLLSMFQEYAQDEDRDLSLANQLGLLMSYHLQAIQHIDQLLEYSNKGRVMMSWKN